jgi:hypothetical protein
VDGTSFECQLDRNPKLNGTSETWGMPHPRGRVWREESPELAAILDVALECPSYRFGLGPDIDCERTSWPEQVASPASFLSLHEDPDVREALFRRALKVDGGTVW